MKLLKLPKQPAGVLYMHHGTKAFEVVETTCLACNGKVYVRASDSLVYPHRCQPKRLEIETVTIQDAEDAIEDAVAAHDFNALASIAHTLRLTLEAERQKALDLDAWVSRMPDAGFNDQDPRWGWWHERPRRAGSAPNGR